MNILSQCSAVFRWFRQCTKSLQFWLQLSSTTTPLVSTWCHYSSGYSSQAQQHHWSALGVTTVLATALKHNNTTGQHLVSVQFWLQLSSTTTPLVSTWCHNSSGYSSQAHHWSALLGVTTVLATALKHNNTTGQHLVSVQFWLQLSSTTTPLVSTWCHNSSGYSSQAHHWSALTWCHYSSGYSSQAQQHHWSALGVTTVLATALKHTNTTGQHLVSLQFWLQLSTTPLVSTWCHYSSGYSSQQHHWSALGVTTVLATALKHNNTTGQHLVSLQFWLQLSSTPTQLVSTWCHYSSGYSSQAQQHHWSALAPRGWQSSQLDAQLHKTRSRRIDHCLDSAALKVELWCHRWVHIRWEVRWESACFQHESKVYKHCSCQSWKDTQTWPLSWK